MYWKRKCKLICKTNSVLKKEMQIDLQNKFCFEKGNANWIAKNIYILWKRKCNLNCKTNHVLEKEIQIDLQNKLDFIFKTRICFSIQYAFPFSKYNLFCNSICISFFKTEFVFAI